MSESKCTKTPTPEELENIRNLLRYENGSLFWTAKVSSQVLAGSMAGRVSTDGYRTVQIGQREYKAHRITWFLCKGEWPSTTMDHVDRDRSNNNISNLRLATPSQNSQNRRYSRISASGVRGVHREPSGKFRAVIVSGGKFTHLGMFDTLESASQARAKAEQEHFGEFAVDALPPELRAAIEGVK